MYISDEQIALERIDTDFKKLVKEADDFAKNTLENISDIDKQHSIEEQPKAQKSTYKSKCLKIEGGGVCLLLLLHVCPHTDLLTKSRF